MATMGLTTLMWMTLWMLPRLIFSLDQHQVIEGRLDPTWSEYIEQIAGQYSEDLPPAPKKKKPVLPKGPRPKGWWTADIGDAPYMAVIYSQQAHNNLKTLDFSKAGAACGAALVAEDKIVTLCACVGSWWMYYASGQWDTQGTHIAVSDYNIKSKYLQVAHTRVIFDPKTHTSRVLGLKNVTELQPRCTNALRAKRNAVDIHEIVVVLLLEEKIKHPIPRQYIPWPPSPILHDAPNFSPAEVITFGMRSKSWPPTTFYGDYDEIKLNITAVIFPMKKVGVENCANEFSEMKKEAQERATCFHPGEPRHEICGGLIGSPVLSMGKIIGLLAFQVNCEREKGPAVVLDFVNPVKELIENFVGGKLLEADRADKNRSPLWRAGDMPQGFVAYEEGVVRKSSHKASLGAICTPSPALTVTLIGAYLFCTRLGTQRIFHRIH